jgi:hypothetical protein
MITNKLLADWLIKKGLRNNSILWIIGSVHVLLYSLLLIAVFLPMQSVSTLFIILSILVASFSIQMTFLNKYLKTRAIL